MNVTELRLFLTLCCIVTMTIVLGVMYQARLEKGKQYSGTFRRLLQTAERVEDIPVIQRHDLSYKNWSEPCDCSTTKLGKPALLFEAVDASFQGEVRERRRQEVKRFRERTDSSRESLLIVDGSAPLSYPVQGVTVAPEGVVELPGLAVVAKEQQDEYKVQFISSKFGVLDVTATVPRVHVAGMGSASLTIRSVSLPHLNRQLQFVVYVNTVFDIDARDFVKFIYLHHQAIIPIRIRARSTPLLYDPGPDDNINEKVTIITKTFLRYDSVRLLLSSIREFYPNIRVIVADDSRPVEDLQAENVDHFVMPFAAGWFAGRSLAVSQVTTPYLLWVDDDYVFVEDTKLETFVNVLDNSNLDVVSGSRATEKLMAYKMAIIPGANDDYYGDCVVMSRAHYGQVPGFPTCYLTTRVTNFFMGRTDKIRSVGFDPTYSRYADREFFLEAMGKLRMAACEGVRVDHRKTINWQYAKFRIGGGTKGGKYEDVIKRHMHFKNNIGCWINA